MYDIKFYGIENPHHHMRNFWMSYLKKNLATLVEKGNYYNKDDKASTFMEKYIPFTLVNNGSVVDIYPWQGAKRRRIKEAQLRYMKDKGILVPRVEVFNDHKLLEKRAQLKARSSGSCSGDLDVVLSFAVSDSGWDPANFTTKTSTKCHKQRKEEISHPIITPLKYAVLISLLGIMIFAST
ncbi:hypothetical protein Cgig2_003072 [Carnegiea gigantea]|uniref:Uncharacterized protein n=1 Tax=Carnegiea gigantea TaxID=171969 RepID=A0A9Q1GLJ4_9CARY|nr:hypothetical protein Cgig2_003072 [Carnegiea gigantea]